MLLKELQFALAAFWTDSEIRKYDVSPVFDEEKVHLYADLIRYGFSDLMSSVYPALNKLIGDEEFARVVDSYISVYPPEHFRLNRAASKFTAYFLDHEEALTNRYPFIVELIDYEWTELDLAENPCQVDTPSTRMPATLSEFQCLGPVLNPVMAMRQFRYCIPEVVDRLTENSTLHGAGLEERTNPVSMVLFRNQTSHKVRFLELDDVPWRMIQHLKRGSYSYLELTRLLFAKTRTKLSPADFASNLIGLVSHLQETGLILGSKPLKAKRKESLRERKRR